MKKFTYPLTGLIGFLILWQTVVSLGFWEENLLPGPISVFKAIIRLTSEGVLIPDILVSLKRFGIGYFIALVAALPLGLLLGWFTTAMKISNSVLQILRPISPMAWFPFVVLWFGIGDAPAIAIIAIAAFFPVLFSTVSAIGKIDETYLKVAQNFEMPQFQFFYKMAIPLAFPYIMVGVRLAIGTAWIFLVAGEMVGAQSGLGYLIIDGRNNIDMEAVMAGIVVIGLIGWGIDCLMSVFEKAVYSRWGINNKD